MLTRLIICNSAFLLGYVCPSFPLMFGMSFGFFFGQFMKYLYYLYIGGILRNKVIDDRLLFFGSLFIRLSVT